jgi:hypothetical protein
MRQEVFHIALEEQHLRGDTDYRERRREHKVVSHFRNIRRNFSKEMIVLHQPESAFNHCVLKMHWAIKSGDLTRQVLLDAKMPRPPADEFTWADQSRGDASHGIFARPLSAKEMNLDTPRKIKATLNRSVDEGAQFEPDHRSILVSAFAYPASSIRQARIQAVDRQP